MSSYAEQSSPSDSGVELDLGQIASELGQLTEVLQIPSNTYEAKDFMYSFAKPHQEDQGLFGDRRGSGVLSVLSKTRLIELYQRTRVKVTRGTTTDGNQSESQSNQNSPHDSLLEGSFVSWLGEQSRSIVEFQIASDDKWTDIIKEGYGPSVKVVLCHSSTLMSMANWDEEAGFRRDLKIDMGICVPEHSEEVYVFLDKILEQITHGNANSMLGLLRGRLQNAIGEAVSNCALYDPTLTAEALNVSFKFPPNGEFPPELLDKVSRNK